MEKPITFETFKEQLIKLFVYAPEPRPEFQEWLHEWYVDYKQIIRHGHQTIKEWADQWFEDYTMQDHGMMLKEKAIKQRAELINEGYRFKYKPLH